MELLERQDPEKKKLMDEVSFHNRQPESGAKVVSLQTEKLLTNAVIIGATLTLSYLIYRSLSGPSKRIKNSDAASHTDLVTAGQKPVTVAEPPVSNASKILSDIGNRLAEEATLFLLNMAKEKLIAYLESKKKPDVQP